MSKTFTGYAICNKKTGLFLASGGSRNVKNLVAARFWATEAGAQGWLDTNIRRPGDSWETLRWVKENREDAEVIPVKFKAEV
jgi:hypothetical protein